MGRTVEKVVVQNWGDMFNVRRGQLTEEQVRSMEIEALADTGTAHLCLPPNVIEELGLLHFQTRRILTANGAVERRVFGGAWVTIQDRSEQMSVMENDQTTPPLIGYLVLEMLDFVVDPHSQKIIPNPAHGGEWITDLY